MRPLPSASGWPCRSRSFRRTSGRRPSFERRTAPIFALLGGFYARACLAVDAPPAIRCVAGTAWALMPPSRVSVVHEESAEDVLREAGEPVLLVSDAKGRTDLAERWGLQVTEVGLGFVAAAPETVFVDVLPGVGRFISPRESKARIQPCEALWLEFAGAHGAIRRDVQFARQGDVLFAMVDLPDADLLAHVLGALGRTLTDQERAAVLADAEIERTRADLERIRGKDGLAAKLLEAIGEGGLRRRLPSPRRRRGRAGGNRPACPEAWRSWRSRCLALKFSNTTPRSWRPRAFGLPSGGRHRFRRGPSSRTWAFLPSTPGSRRRDSRRCSTWTAR